MAQIGPKYNSSHFTWIKDENCFITEASSLPGRVYGPLYDDACDTGFWMTSAKTGDTIAFMLSEKLYDEEGELYGWEFESWGDKPSQCGIRARVFND